MKEQLYINNTYIPLSKSINPSITRSITDVENPDKRKAVYSKTTTVPFSKELMKVLGFIFELNITNSSFNPTVKADVLYIVNDEPIIEGYCQVKSIKQVEQVVESADIVMYGSIADLFGELGNKELKELVSGFTNSLDQWDHPLTKGVIDDSWDTQVYNSISAGFVPFAYGTGYVYPLVDYGRVTDLTKWPYYEMPFSLYALEYIRAIEGLTGIKFESTFFDSDYFKRMIIPSSPDNYSLTQTEITDRQMSANTPQLTSTGTTTSANLPTSAFSFSTPDTIIFTNELTDVNGIYNDLTGVVTTSPVTTGFQTISTLIDVSATFTPSTAAAVYCTSDIEGYFMVFRNGVQVQAQQFRITYDDFAIATTGARSTAASATYPDTDYLESASTPYSQSVTVGAANNIARTTTPPNRFALDYTAYLNNTDTIEIKWKARYVGLNGDSAKMFSGGGFDYGGNATITVDVGALFTKYNNTYLSEGSTIQAALAVPSKVKIKDFFMSLCKMFNLWVDVHPTKSKHLIVETRDEFYSTDVLDIQSKLANDKDLIQVPMGKLDASDYDFTYRADKDELNTRYEGQYDEIYGRRRILNQNDFVTKSKKIETIFSPTVLSAPAGDDKVISTIIGLDNTGQRKPIDHNIRILYYGGMKNCSTVWGMNGGSGGNAILNPLTQYPYAGHFSDPYNSLEDINFGLVKEVYYDSVTATPITVNNNNLYNKYYSRMLAEYTDSESKIVTGWFNINPADFKQWTFDKLYHFENSYFRLQKIYNYNPTKSDLTKCDFLYLTEAPAFTPEDLGLDGDNPPITGPPFGTLDVDETKPVAGGKSAFFGDGNTTLGKSVTVNGVNNYVANDSYYIDINGDGNTIENGSKNVLITGDNNTIGSGFENITLINTSDTEVLESNVTYINGKKVGSGSIGGEITATETVDFIVDDNVDIYYLDGSGAGIRVSLNNSISEFTFKCTDSTNRVYIQAAPSLIDNTSTDFDLLENESIRLKWDTTDSTYYIIN